MDSVESTSSLNEGMADQDREWRKEAAEIRAHKLRLISYSAKASQADVMRSHLEDSNAVLVVK
jgi:hypothetical protein